MNIRLAEERDWNRIWPIIHAIVRTGDTYAYEPQMSELEARAVWLDAPQRTYVLEQGEELLGTYYLKPNAKGPGSHVCNCGYMIAESARNQGLAARLCEHSQQVAVQLGYRAMQFNFVAQSNEGAIYLWTRLGFETVGRLPGAFNHPTLGYVDALVMYKHLVGGDAQDGL